VNTRDLETGEDALAAPADLVAWLRAGGLVAGQVRATPADLERAVTLRESLRALLLVNNGGAPDRAAVGVVDGAAKRAGVGLRFRGAGNARLEPAATGVDAGLGCLLGIVAASMADRTWSRLKVCRAEECQWAYYDRARNRSRAWCSMAVCGNRTKARAYRARRQGGDGVAQPVL
jgi:predicted RNA-binding Zn ribbon-like protein